MRLDTPTLFLMTVVVTFVVGVLFLMSWLQSRRTRALAIWGVAHLGGAVASALLSLRGVVPDLLSIGLANALMLSAYGLIWSGVRSFEGRSPAYPVAFSGGAIWIAACLMPDFYASLTARIVLASSIAGLSCAAAAFEIWRGRAEPLVSRYSAIALMSAYGLAYFVRLPLTVIAPPPANARGMDSPWLAVLCFAGTLFTVAIAFVLIALTKERAERQQRLAAESDPLTGIANRRAFVGEADVLLADRSRPVCLLLFDLDHFKAVNDTYGHAVGDAVLVAFCHLATALVPSGAMLGRIGGEEFACMLPGADAAEGARVAERVRRALSRIAVLAFPALTIRTSVGVAARGSGAPDDLDALLRRADDALYRAKTGGRDRVAVESRSRRDRAA